MGAKSQDIKERLEVTKRNYVVHPERRTMGETPSDSAKVRIRKTQELRHAS